MVIKEDYFKCFASFSIKNPPHLINLVELVSLMNQIINWQTNSTNQLLKNLKKRSVYSSFRDNIWGVDLADMQSLSKYNKGIKYLFFAIDLFSKYALVIPIKDKKGTSIVNAF